MYAVKSDRSFHKKKMEEILLSPMTKAPSSTEKSKKQRDNTKTPLKSSITQRLLTEDEKTEESGREEKGNRDGKKTGYMANNITYFKCCLTYIWRV